MPMRMLRSVPARLRSSACMMGLHSTPPCVPSSFAERPRSQRWLPSSLHPTPSTSKPARSSSFGKQGHACRDADALSADEMRELERVLHARRVHRLLAHARGGLHEHMVLGTCIARVHRFAQFAIDLMLTAVLRLLLVRPLARPKTAPRAGEMAVTLPVTFRKPHSFPFRSHPSIRAL